MRRDSIGHLGLNFNSYERMTFSAICKWFICRHLRTAEFIYHTGLYFHEKWYHPVSRLLQEIPTNSCLCNLQMQARRKREERGFASLSIRHAQRNL
jgi:hypothetical protein